MSARSSLITEAHDPVRDVDGPVSAVRPVLNETDEPARNADSPANASAPPISRADDPALAKARPVTREEFRAFITNPLTKKMVLKTVRESAPEGVVEDLAQDALLEALVAFEVAPPAKRHALPGWMETIARRTVASYLEKRTRRSQYEGEMPKVVSDAKLDKSGTPASPSDRPEPSASESVYDPREVSDEDDAMEGARLFRWLEKQVEANPRDRETLQMVLEHGRTDKAYYQIATEHGLTVAAVSSRIHEFKKKYTPRYKRERERAVLLLFLFGVALVALVLYLLSRPGAPPQRGQSAPPTPIIDQIFGGPLPVGAPPPNGDIHPDGGSPAPKE